MNNKPETMQPVHDYKMLLDSLDALSVFNDIHPHTLSRLFYLIQDLTTYNGKETITSQSLSFKVGRYGKPVLLENNHQG